MIYQDKINVEVEYTLEPASTTQ